MTILEFVQVGIFFKDTENAFKSPSDFADPIFHTVDQFVHKTIILFESTTGHTEQTYVERFMGVDHFT